MTARSSQSAAIDGQPQTDPYPLSPDPYPLTPIPRPLAALRSWAWHGALVVVTAVVLLAVVADARDLARPLPRLGLLVAPGGRVVAVDADGPATRAGVLPGDLVTSIGGVAPGPAALEGVRTAPLHSLITVVEQADGRFELFTAQVSPPSTATVVGDIAAMVVAVLLWLSCLHTGFRGRAFRWARSCALAAALLAFSLLSLLGASMDGGWGWYLALPAGAAGLAYLLATQLEIAGATARLNSGLLFSCPLLFGLVAGAIDLATSQPAADLSIAAILCALALAIVATPLAWLGRQGSGVEGRGLGSLRRLRIAHIGALAGLLPILVWPGLATMAALAGHQPPLLSGAHVSSWLAAIGLMPMAALYDAMATTRTLGRVDRWARRGAAVVAALLVATCLWLALDTRLGGPRLVLAALLLLVTVLIARALWRELAMSDARARADIEAAARYVEACAAEIGAPHAIAQRIVERLPGLLGVRSVAIILGARQVADGAYRAFGLESDAVDTGAVAALIHRLSSAADQIIVTDNGMAGEPEGALSLPAGLWAPLSWEGDVRGALAVLAWPGDDDPTVDIDRDAIEELAGRVSLALHMATLATQVQERSATLTALAQRVSDAHEQERAGLARELHDVVAQELIALTRHLRRYEDGTVPPPAIWTDMLTAAQDALASTRRICNGLRPAMLDLGIVPALRDLVADVSSAPDAPTISLTVLGGERRCSGEVEFALFRVAQEALHNALLHAGAARVLIEVCFDAGLRLVIRDDGRGFVVPARFEDVIGDHLGLIGMRERLAQIGGDLHVTSTPGRGTVVEARYPGDRGQGSGVSEEENSSQGTENRTGKATQTGP